MAKILVIDDAPFWRELAADGLRLKGHEVVTAEDGLEGLAVLKNNGVDLVILDVEMPKLQGLGFMENLRRLPQFGNLPVIMLTGDMQKEHVLKARRLGASDYLLKTRFSLTEMIDRVERQLIKHACAAVQVHAAATPALEAKGHDDEKLLPLLTHEQSMERAQSALNGCSLSGVIMQVITTAMSPRLDMVDLASLVGRDPYLAYRILQTSNKVAYVSNRGVISTLDEAVRLLGSSSVRDIAASVGVFQAMPPAEPDGFNPTRCWQHSIAVGRLCSLLAPKKHQPAAYLVGLCHDLGGILFRTHFGNEYRHVLEVEKATGQPRQTLEREMLGVTHAELAMTIFKHLEFPSLIQDPVAAFYHAATHNAPLMDPLARILQIADAMASGLGLSPSDQELLRPFGRTEMRTATGLDNPPRIDSQEFRSEIVVLTAQFDQLAAVEQSKSIQFSPTSESPRIWLARDASLSELDPITSLLETRTFVTMNNRLPTISEFKGHDAMVVLTRNGTTSGLTLDEAAAQGQAMGLGAKSILYMDAKTAKSQDVRLIHETWPLGISALQRFIVGLK